MWDGNGEAEYVLQSQIPRPVVQFLFGVLHTGISAKSTEILGVINKKSQRRTGYHMHVNRHTSEKSDWKRLVRIPLHGAGAKITLAFVLVTIAFAGVGFYIWDRIDTVLEVSTTMTQRGETITKATAVVQNSIFDEIWAVGRFHQGAKEEAVQTFQIAREEMDKAVHILKESNVFNTGEFDSLSLLRHRFHSDVGFMFALTESLRTAQERKDVKAVEEFERSHEQTMASVDALRQLLEEMLLELQVRTTERTGEGQRVVRGMINQVKLSLVGLSGFLILVAVAAWFMTEMLVTRPLQRLTDQIKSIKADNFMLPLQIGAPDEVKALEESFNEMLANLQRNIQKRQEDELELMREHKLAAIGQLAQGIAHNLNNPLSVIMLASEGLMKRNPSSFEAGVVAKSAQKMKAIIDTLLYKSRQEQTQARQQINLNNLIEEELRFLEADIEFKHKIQKRVVLAPGLPEVNGAYSDFSQSFMNIVRNAIDAMYQSPEKALTVQTRFDEKHIYIDVGDTGVGIPEENIRKLFDPFFTTKPIRGTERGDEPVGTGLGLASCYQIIQPYGATISVTSAVGKGSTFTIAIPYTSQ